MSSSSSFLFCWKTRQALKVLLSTFCITPEFYVQVTPALEGELAVDSQAIIPPAIIFSQRNWTCDIKCCMLNPRHELAGQPSTTELVTSFICQEKAYHQKLHLAHNSIKEHLNGVVHYLVSCMTPFYRRPQQRRDTIRYCHIYTKRKNQEKKLCWCSALTTHTLPQYPRFNKS